MDILLRQISLHRFATFALVVITGFMTINQAWACTRVVYLGENDQIMTGRSMDWKYDIGTNLWVFPRGMTRNGVGGPNSLQWVSKYGSVIATGYDVSTTDGLNEKGLAANLLWLAESNYPTVQKGQHPISVSVWAQYLLDNFATVSEAVEAYGTNRWSSSPTRCPVRTVRPACIWPFPMPPAIAPLSNTLMANKSSIMVVSIR